MYVFSIGLCIYEMNVFLTKELQTEINHLSLGVPRPNSNTWCIPTTNTPRITTTMSVITDPNMVYNDLGK